MTLSQHPDEERDVAAAPDGKFYPGLSALNCDALAYDIEAHGSISRIALKDVAIFLRWVANGLRSVEQERAELTTLRQQLTVVQRECEEARLSQARAEREHADLRVLIGEAQRQMRKSIGDARQQERRADECEAWLTEAQADRDRLDWILDHTIEEFEQLVLNADGVREAIDAARLASSSETPANG